ncbi:Msb3p [Sugiyamaella lignohabitans]|uniref:Msb3p n=1 Tax=Sugiyamaella lignohabitans TaxID=796027 RepID=A0A167EQQ5_9ASCO|nr:Msb3p [Sugiyamaella lignohabitans]ANB14356.1 Msb3p [Sugiyamaella lignohabitans]
MNEERSFWMLHIITQRYLPGVHEVNLEGVNIDHGVLMIYLRQNLPNFWDRLCVNFDGQRCDEFISKLPPISLAITAWFMGAFVTILPPESMLRVWDCMFYEGPRILFRVALSIFKLCEPRVKDISDQMEMFQYIQNFPKGLTDPVAFLDICFRHVEAIKDDDLNRTRKFVTDRRKLAFYPQGLGGNDSGNSSDLPAISDLDAYRAFRASSSKKGLSLNFHLKHQLRAITVKSRRLRHSSSIQSASAATSDGGSFGRRLTSFPKKSKSLRSSATSTHS